MSELNKTCMMCGTKYAYCPNCASYARHPEWKALFDCEECHDVYTIINKYVFKHISKAVAREQLAKYDVSKMDKTIQETIAEINTMDAEELQQVSETIEQAKSAIETADKVAEVVNAAPEPDKKFSYGKKKRKK